MLDAFTEVLVKQASSKAQEDELTELMMRLPIEEAYKFASGTAVKVAYCGDDNGNWLEKYEGTPLFEQAIALEEELLAIEGKRIAKRAEQPPVDDLYAQEDMIRLKKRLLDLELHKAGASSGEEVEEEKEAGVAGMSPEEAAALSQYADENPGAFTASRMLSHGLVGAGAGAMGGYATHGPKGALVGGGIGGLGGAGMALANTPNVRAALKAKGAKAKTASAKDSYRKSGIAGLGQHGGAIVGGLGGTALGAIAGRREMGGVLAPVALGTLGGLAGVASGDLADRTLTNRWGKVEKGSKESKEKESACKTAEPNPYAYGEHSITNEQLMADPEYAAATNALDEASRRAPRGTFLYPALGAGVGALAGGMGAAALMRRGVSPGNTPSALGNIGAASLGGLAGGYLGGKVDKVIPGAGARAAARKEMDPLWDNAMAAEDNAALRIMTQQGANKTAEADFDLAGRAMAHALYKVANGQAGPGQPQIDGARQAGLDAMAAHNASPYAKEISRKYTMGGAGLGALVGGVSGLRRGKGGLASGLGGALGGGIGGGVLGRYVGNRVNEAAAAGNAAGASQQYLKMSSVNKVAFTPFHAAAGGIAGAYNAPKGHRLEGAAAGAKGATLGALKGGAYHGATGAAGGAAAGLLPAALTGGLSVPVLATMGGVGGALEGGVSGGVSGYKKSMDDLRAKVGQ